MGVEVRGGGESDLCYSIAGSVCKGGRSDLWSLFVLAVERIANRTFLGTLDRSLDELIVDFLLDKDARSGTAALSLVEEQSKVTLFHGLVHCSQTSACH